MSLALTRIALHSATFATLALSTAFSGAFGPPHITVRQVTQGMQAPTGAVLLIETAHHTDPADLSISGRAEGIVNGKRVSNTLQFTRQSLGHYSLTRQWQPGSPWVLVLAAQQGPDGKHGVAEALVKVDASGTVTNIDYPAAGWVNHTDTPKRTSAADIEAMLSSMVARR
jgi:hypothetical protein